MTNPEENNAKPEYRYYDYHEGHIAREKVGSSYSDGYRFEFYDRDGVWEKDLPISLSLSDAIMGVCGCSVFEYEELTEEEAMRRIAEIDRKYRNL